MARLLLIRHAPTPETGKRLTGRIAGVSLGPKGEAIARKTADRLAEVKLVGVYTSPIDRTAETAAIIATPHGLTPITEEGVTEVDFGTWEGKTLAQMRRLKLFKHVVSTPSQVTFPDGESFPDVQTRAVAACNRIASATGKGTAAVVSHSDVIKTILAHYLGQPLDLFQRLVIAPASVSVVHVPAEGAPRVETINSFGAVA